MEWNVRERKKEKNRQIDREKRRKRKEDDEEKEEEMWEFMGSYSFKECHYLYLFVRGINILPM